MPVKKLMVSGLADDRFRIIVETLNNLVDQFNTHSHKTPTTQPGITSEPVSNAPDVGSTGGTAIVFDEKIFDSNTNTEI